MKAIVRHRYGTPDELNLEDIPKPVPQDDQLLIKVHATSINAMDWRFLKADPFFIRLMLGLWTPKQKVLGFNIAGVVEAVGKDVQAFQVGDEVFGTCNGGGFAEYVCTFERALVLKPSNVTFEQAAALPTAAQTALQGLRDAGKIEAGQKVLIHGASGGVGTFAVQIAKHFGAEVTAVCSTRNVEMVRSLGADYVIDYKKEDFAKNGECYDLIFGINGNRSIFDFRRSLCENGRYVLGGGSGLRQMMQTRFLGRRLSGKDGKQLFAMPTTTFKKDDLITLGELVNDGSIRPVIDHCYPLEQTREAFWYIEKEHARGKVVICPKTI